MTTPNRPEDAENLGGNFAALGALDDPLAADAIELVVKEQQASVSFFQRRLGIGYGRAARIIEAMEKDGIIGPQTSLITPREVHMKEVPANLQDLIDRGREAQPAEALQSFDNMPPIFASPMSASNNLDTSSEIGERDPLFQKATEWVAQQATRASLTDLRTALNIPAVRTEAMLVAMKEKSLVRQSGFMPFPQFFEYTPPPIPVAPATAAPASRSNPFADRPTPAASTPRLDARGNEWTGVDDSFSGHGKVVYQDGVIEEGLFVDGNLLEGKRTERHGSTLEGKFDSDMLLSGTITERWKIINGDFAPDDGRLMNGTIKYLDDGSVRTIVNGIGVEDSGSRPIFTADPDIDDKSHDESEPYVRIKSIRENAQYGMVPKSKEGEANRGIERVEDIVRKLPEEDRRLIGELHITFMDRLTLAPQSKLGAIFGRKPKSVPRWRARDTQVESMIIQIDPLRLPADENEIAEYLIGAAKIYAAKQNAEMAVSELKEATQIPGLELNYDHGSPNFHQSLPGIEKIKKAIVEGMDEEETGMLSRSNMLLLMVGQKKEDYAGSKYKIILSCDTEMSTDEITSFLRGELRRIEQKDAAGRSPSRKPTKKSAPGIFSSTRGKIAGALAALAVVGAGAAAVHQNNKPVPVDTTPAPKAPKAPKAPEKAAEPPKAPEEAAEAPKAPEAPKKESGEIKKVDLSKIPLNGKVTFKTLEDGAKMGVLKKNSRGKYEPVDAFDFDGDDDRTVIRIQ